ncbi:MAG: hypothetical protein JXR03_07925 [Cyclobacteriaceae bacterium]
MTKKAEEGNKPKVNKDLKGFDIAIDSFGEIKSSLSIDQINQFLNKNVDDKKLRDRDDLEDLKSGSKD